jgi:Family of unknown function (DUF6496)
MPSSIASLAQVTEPEDSKMAAKKKSGARKVKRAMHKMKRGTLKSGRSGKTVKSRKQAIAIGLSEARKAGAKIPTKKKTARKK